MIDEAFERERAANRADLARRQDLKALGLELLIKSSEARYSYNWDWLGLPIIQFPPDVVAVQELLWRVRPGAVVETGVARGGSLALSASILKLIGEDGIVVGVDIDIRDHNRRALEAHPLADRIKLVQGSSVEPEIVSEVTRLIDGRGPVLVILDSMHTHEHVLLDKEQRIARPRQVYVGPGERDYVPIKQRR